MDADAKSAPPKSSPPGRGQGWVRQAGHHSREIQNRHLRSRLLLAPASPLQELHDTDAPSSRRSGALTRREGGRGERNDGVGPVRPFVPGGTRFIFMPQPSDESLGYFRASLRDVDSRHADKNRFQAEPTFLAPEFTRGLSGDSARNSARPAAAPISAPTAPTGRKSLRTPPRSTRAFRA